MDSRFVQLPMFFTIHIVCNKCGDRITVHNIELAANQDRIAEWGLGIDDIHTLLGDLHSVDLYVSDDYVSITLPGLCPKCADGDDENGN